MDTKTLSQIAEVADQVAAEHAELEQAKGAELAQGVIVLDALIERIRGAIPALVSRVASAETTTWHGQTTDTDVDYFSWRGLRVWGEGAERDHLQDNRGRYGGRALYLARHPSPVTVSWQLVTYDGHWSRWQGEGEHWEGESETVTTAHAIAVAKLKGIVAAIDGALQSHLGKRDKASARARMALCAVALPRAVQIPSTLAGSS